MSYIKYCFFLYIIILTDCFKQFKLIQSLNLRMKSLDFDLHVTLAHTAILLYCK